MKPLYSMERNKCSLIPFHGVEGFHSTPNSTPERSRTECRSLSIPLYSAQDCAEVVQKLCKSCAEVVQKLCKSSEEVVPIACTHCALHCLLPLCVALLAPTVRCIACYHCALHCLHPLCVALLVPTVRCIACYHCALHFLYCTFISICL